VRRSAISSQRSDPRLAEHFRPVAEALAANESTILTELTAAQGSPQDLGGYYRPDPERAAAVMRPSATLNAIIDGI
jgi:isocitrate dehydrogenase